MNHDFLMYKRKITFLHIITCRTHAIGACNLVPPCMADFMDFLDRRRNIYSNNK